MGQKYPCPWSQYVDNRACLSSYLDILKRGVPEELDALPQEFLEQWWSMNSGAGVVHYVACHGLSPETTLSFFQKRGVDCNKLSLNGSHALQHAINRGASATMNWCRALVEAGANLHVMPCKGVSLLASAVATNNPSLVHWCHEQGVGRSSAALKDIDQPDAHKILRSTPERMNEAVQAFEMLWPATGADLSRQLLLALEHGRLGWADSLKEAGAPLTGVNGQGATALHLLFSNLSLLLHDLERVNQWVEWVAHAGVGLHDLDASGQSALGLLDGKSLPPDAHDRIRSTLLSAFHEGHARALNKGTALAASCARRVRL